MACSLMYSISTTYCSHPPPLFYPDFLQPVHLDLTRGCRQKNRNVRSTQPPFYDLRQSGTSFHHWHHHLILNSSSRHELFLLFLNQHHRNIPSAWETSFQQSNTPAKYASTPAPLAHHRLRTMESPSSSLVTAHPCHIEKSKCDGASHHTRIYDIRHQRNRWTQRCMVHTLGGDQCWGGWSGHHTKQHWSVNRSGPTQWQPTNESGCLLGKWRSR